MHNHSNVLMMRRIILIPFSCAVLMALNVHAQTQSDSTRNSTSKNVVKINPASVLLGTVNIHYERRSSPKYSHQFEVFVHTGRFYNGSTVNGFGVTYNMRSYRGRKVSAGFYTQPYLRFQQYRGDVSQDWLGSMSSKPNTRIHLYTVGYLLGYQFNTNSRWVIDVFGGLNLNIAQIDEKLLPVPFPFARLGLTIGFQL